MPYKDPEVRKRNARGRYLRDQQERIEYARRQRAERGEEINERRRELYQERKEETAAARLAYQRAWHDQHPGYAGAASYRRRLAHPEDAEYHAQWQRDHAEATRSYVAQRRGAAAQGMSEQDKLESIEWRKLIASDSCFYCGTTEAAAYEDDHYASIANGGTDHWWNLVRACQPCNRMKATMNGDDFLERLICGDERQGQVPSVAQ